MNAGRTFRILLGLVCLGLQVLQAASGSGETVRALTEAHPGKSALYVLEKGEVVMSGTPTGLDQEKLKATMSL